MDWKIASIESKGRLKFCFCEPKDTLESCDGDGLLRCPKRKMVKYLRNLGRKQAAHIVRKERRRKAQEIQAAETAVAGMVAQPRTCFIANSFD